MTDPDYPTEWKLIDSLQQAGLLRSALDGVLSLKQRALTAGQEAQLVKTTLFEAKLTVDLEEDGMVKAINLLRKEAATAPEPRRSVLQSLLAELYFRYLDENVWEIGQRTSLAEAPGEDIQTWPAAFFEAEAARLYLASLTYPGLVNSSLDKYAAILSPSKNVEGLWSNLYDLLAFRAIDYFSDSRSALHQPVYRFYLNQPEAFLDAESFAAFRFEAQDTAAANFRALLLFQELLRKINPASTPAAWIDVNVRRLAFVHEKSVLSDKDQRYAAALLRLEQRFPNQPGIAEAMYARASLLIQRGNTYNPEIGEAHRLELQEAKKLMEEVVQRFPGSVGAELCGQKIQELRAVQVEVQTESVLLPGRKALVSIGFKNSSRLYFRVVHLSQEQWEYVQRQSDPIQRLIAFQPFRSWHTSLPDDGDLQKHRTEVMMDALPLGKYALLVSADSNFKSGNGAGLDFHYFSVSELACNIENNYQGDWRIMVTHRLSGAPIPGVNVQLTSAEYGGRRERSQVKTEHGKTDAQGIARLSLDSRQYSVLVSLGEDSLDLGERFYGGRGYDNNRSQAREETVFFLDRAIYRPGQLIFFKGLCLLRQGELSNPELLAGKHVQVILRNANYEEVAKASFSTNEFGTFSGSFTAPLGGLSGQMILESSVGSSSHSFRVEEYKRPRFEAALLPLEAEARLGKMVSLKGEAKNFAGNPVDGANVTYRVVRSVRYPWRWWWRGYSAATPAQEIAHGETTTDAEGLFRISFEALPDLSVSEADLPEYQFEIHADVVDITGETHSASRSVTVGYRSLHLSTDLGEEVDKIAQGGVVVHATNLDGQPLAVPGTIQLFPLKAPGQWFTSRYWALPDRVSIPESTFRKEFPLFAYGKEEDRATWERGALVWSGAFHTEQTDTVSIPFNTLPNGYYVLVLKALDADGQEVEKQAVLQLFDTAAKTGPQPNPLWVAWNKPAAEPGQTAYLQLYDNHNETSVFVELRRGKETLKSLWVQPKGWTTISWAISEADRGNIYACLTYVRHNRAFSEVYPLQVPWSNKELQISYETFRDKLLPGQQEEWRLLISGSKAEKVSAELVAAMYDASLDQFVPHGWDVHLFNSYPYPNVRWNAQLFGAISSSFYQSQTKNWDTEKTYPDFNWFGFPFWGGYIQVMNDMTYESHRIQLRSMQKMVMAEAPMPPPPSVELSAYSEKTADDSTQRKDEIPISEEPVLQTRTNLNETVFFFPQLKTDAEGRVILSFKMNEALTRWKLMALAHTRNLESAYSVQEVVTQKDLMVFPNAPRFLREKDALVFTAKVSNLSEKVLQGKARLELFDAATMQPVDGLFGNEQPTVSFEAEVGLSVPVSWQIKVPEGKVGALTYRVSAVAGNFSDAEENTLPVLTNRMLVTETLPLYVPGNKEKSFTLESMKDSRESSTLVPFRLSLDFTPNPAWLAVKALPYLMEYPHECSEQVFSRYFANSLSAAVIAKTPRIKAIFDLWKGTDALDSELSKNQELKSALLQETPWVLESQSEETQRRNIALLFDLNRLGYEQQNALRKLSAHQNGNGSFSWFAGGPESWYITQYIVSGLGKLRYLGVNHATLANEIWEKGLGYIDQKLSETYHKLLEEVQAGRTTLEGDHLGVLEAQYLYARSFARDIPCSPEIDTVVTYYLTQATRYWTTRGNMEQAMLAVALQRWGKPTEAIAILASLRERALHSEEMGMYWKSPRGYYWYQRPTESQAMLIEAFDEIGKNAAEVDELKQWLLTQKRTSDWGTTTATAEAVYALFRTGAGANWLASDKPVGIRFDNARHKNQVAEKIQQAAKHAEPGTGNFKVSWQESEIERGMHTITLKNPNPSVAWGGLYWQYFEDLDNIKSFEETPLTLKKTLYREEIGDRGMELHPLAEGVVLHPGDKVVVRLELRVDRAMEYVHLKDMRASGLEPIAQLSGYRWQGGLGYYESPGDLATNFFLDYLGRGTYVFEYPLRVTQKGDFSNGLTTIQCMYAPEFSSHSQGIRIEVR